MSRNRAASSQMTSPHAPRILIAAPIPADLRAALAQRYEVVDRADVRGWPAEPAAGFAVAVTTSMNGIDAPTIDALPDLRLVLCQGAGIDRLDLAAARRRGIAVTHTPDELADDVGEAAIAMIYAVMRRVAEADRFVRAGRWGKERIAPSTRVAGKTLGIVGLGRIGRRVAQLGQAIGMTILYFGRRPADAPYAFVADLHQLASQSDVLVLSCPGGDATRHLINKPVLDRLGPQGFLVNVSRGSVVDEAALIEALQTGAIAGAALDVFASEPNLDPRFLALENVVLQPHSTSITHETRAAMIGRILADLDAFLHGRPFQDAAASAPAR
jgi:lactate dehydrogenase-like 2-hydroxyacid dehydrogenase